MGLFPRNSIFQRQASTVALATSAELKYELTTVLKNGSSTVLYGSPKETNTVFFPPENVSSPKGHQSVLIFLCRTSSPRLFYVSSLERSRQSTSPINSSSLREATYFFRSMPISFSPYTQSESKSALQSSSQGYFIRITFPPLFADSSA